MTSDDSSAYGCTHCPSGARRCPFQTWPSWPPNVSTPLLDAHLRAQPHLQLFATDASPSGAGACSTPVSLELWTRLHDFSDEQGCSVRLDWDMNSMPTPELRDSRAAVAGLVVDLPWVESFSYRFRYPQHFNLLELEALISLIRGLVDRGLGSRRRQPSCSWISVKGAFQQPTCELPSSSPRGSIVGKQFVARFVGCFLGQIPAKHHRVSTRLARGGPLSRRFLDSCTSPQKLFLKLRSKLTDCSSHLARKPEPVYNVCEKNREPI